MIGKDTVFWEFALLAQNISFFKKNLKADDLKSVILFSPKVSSSTSSWSMHGK